MSYFHANYVNTFGKKPHQTPNTERALRLQISARDSWPRQPLEPRQHVVTFGFLQDPCFVREMASGLGFPFQLCRTHCSVPGLPAKPRIFHTCPTHKVLCRYYCPPHPPRPRPVW